MACACGRWPLSVGKCRDCWRQERAETLQQLSKEFGEPVLPLSVVCDAIQTWIKAIEENQRRPVANPSIQHGADYARHLRRIFTDIQKSGLMARLLYRGEALRTEECPVHHGHMATGLWVLGGDDCCDGSGWLEASEARRAERRAWVAKTKERYPQLWPDPNFWPKP